MYSIWYKCTNCGQAFEKQFSKGELATLITRCPHCECFTGEREQLERPIKEVNWHYISPSPFWPYATPPPHK